MIIKYLTEFAEHSPQAAADREPEDAVVLVSPEYYSVDYVTNIHSEEMVGSVNSEKAIQQWNAFKDALESIHTSIAVIEGVQNIPDQVFTANTAVVHKKADGVHVLLSNMALDSRQPEVEIFKQWAVNNEYQTHQISDDLIKLEGNGDTLWHPGKQWLYVGHGHRTTTSGVEALEKFTEATIVQLELVDERWYHLDVALSPIRDDLALMVPMAFTEEGRAMIRKCFKTVIEVSEIDALNFAVNGFSPDNEHYIVQSGSNETTEKLRQAGVEVIEIDTSEYMKAGGSVFCMKQQVYI